MGRGRKSTGDTFIANKMKELGLSMQDMEAKTGLSHSYLSLIVNGKKKNVTLEIIVKIAIALEVDYSLIVRDMLNKPDTEEENKY